MLRGGIVLTFSGTNLDVVAQPVFVYTDPHINSTLGVRRVYVYSGTSDKGPSEIGTTSLQRRLVVAPCYYFSVLFYL